MSEPSSSNKNSDIMNGLGAILLVLVVIFAGLMLLSFPLGAYAFYNGNLSTSSSEPFISKIPIFVVGLPIDLPARTTFADLFAVLWVIYLVLFVIAINGPHASLPQILKRSGSQGVRFSDNAIVATIMTFTSVTLLTSLIERLQTSVGVASGSLPESDPLQTFAGIALAPLTEEIGFRVSTIGLIAFTVLLGRADFGYALKALWHPERYLGIPSRGRNATLPMIYIIAIISGLLFGLAHILFGAGWQIGKFTTSSIAGIALGLLYIKVGLPAAVLMHWSFNYYRSSYYYFELAVGETFLREGMEIMLVMIGAMSLLYYALSRTLKQPKT